VEIKDAHEAVIQKELEKSAKLLQEIVRSGNPERALANRLDEIDQTFFMILSANIEEAQRQKNEDAVKALTIIGNIAMSMIQQREMQRAKSTAEDASAEPEKPKIEVAR
jgi:hypothetical protein